MCTAEIQNKYIACALYNTPTGAFSTESCPAVDKQNCSCSKSTKFFFKIMTPQHLCNNLNISENTKRRFDYKCSDLKHL